MVMPRLVAGFLMAFVGIAAPAFSDTLLQVPHVIFAAPPQVFAAADSSQGSAPPPVAFTYSDAYQTRAKIHKIASYATLPLFGAEAIVGQSLYSNPTSTKKSAHLAIATGMGVLFGVNTVTGVWNLVEARKDPSHRGTRLLHGILMLAADGGFLATAALGPSSEHGGSNFANDRSTHRAVAFTSIGLATAGYLVMLLGAH
jgi:hypothetical protein